MSNEPQAQQIICPRRKAQRKAIDIAELPLGFTFRDDGHAAPYFVCAKCEIPPSDEDIGDLRDGDGHS